MLRLIIYTQAKIANIFWCILKTVIRSMVSKHRSCDTGEITVFIQILARTNSRPLVAANSNMLFHFLLVVKSSWFDCVFRIEFYYLIKYAIISLLLMIVSLLALNTIYEVTLVVWLWDTNTEFFLLKLFCVV